MCIISFAGLGQTGWINQTPSSEYPGLFGICAVDSAHVWAVGNDHEGTVTEEIVLRSTNGGDSWDIVNTGFNERFTGVIFINCDTGFISGQAADDEPFIIRSFDAGQNWQRLDIRASVITTVNDIEFHRSESEDSIFMYVAGGLGYVWKSKDLGDSWNVLSGGCRNGNFNACFFIDKNTGWFVGTPDAQYNNSIMVTRNGGVDFTEQINPEQRKLNEVSFANADTGIVVGLSSTILYTKNGGETWENKPNTGYRWQSVQLTASGRAWAVGNDGTIGYSTDYGYSWEIQESGMEGYELWDVSFINDNEGWIVGGGIGSPGIVLHTTTGGAGTTEIDPDDPGGIFSLGQNYPNPFTRTTRIRYKIETPGMITISLYNVLGNRLEYLVNEYKPQGAYTIDFMNDHYPRGIYFYELKAGSELIQTRRMIIL